MSNPLHVRSIYRRDRVTVEVSRINRHRYRIADPAHGGGPQFRVEKNIKPYIRALIDKSIRPILMEARLDRSGRYQLIRLAVAL